MIIFDLIFYEKFVLCVVCFLICYSMFFTLLIKHTVYSSIETTVSYFCSVLWLLMGQDDISSSQGGPARLLQTVLCFTLQCIALYCTTLHCNALDCTALHIVTWVRCTIFLHCWVKYSSRMTPLSSLFFPSALSRCFYLQLLPGLHCRAACCYETVKGV